MPPKQIKHKGRVISKQIEIAAPPEAVWNALTDPEELKRWFPLDARVKPGPGGEIFLSSRDSPRRGRSSLRARAPWRPRRHLIR
jgi:uncharacterized protein YndB with AHSA1/START domain